MVDTSAMTDGKSRVAEVLGLAYIIVGACVVAYLVYSLGHYVLRIHSTTVNTKVLQLRNLPHVVIYVLFKVGLIGVGATLIGGGIYLRRRQENGRMAVIVASAILLALSAPQLLVALLMLFVMISDQAGASEMLGATLRSQATSLVLTLMMAAALCFLLVQVTRPAVEDAMLPRTPAASGGFDEAGEE